MIRNNIWEHSEPFKKVPKWPDKELKGYFSTDKCCLCGNVLQKKGALLWSPPDKKSKCDKDYVCVNCYHELIKGKKK